MSEREEAIKIYCLAENELIRLIKQEMKLKEQLKELNTKHLDLLYKNLD